MGDLARRRNARDLWISRSHVYAGGVGVVLLVACSYGLGLLHGAASHEASRSEVVSLSGEIPNDDLVELLARVEATAHVRGDVEILTFPAALSNSPSGSAVDVDPPPAGRFSIEVARFSDVGQARPLRDHLREQDLKAWIAVELVGGEMSYRVAIGGFSGEPAASEALVSVAEALAAFPGGSYQPRVVEHRH